MWLLNQLLENLEHSFLMPHSPFPTFYFPQVIKSELLLFLYSDHNDHLQF